MLHYIRDRAQGWVAWFIVGLISIPFALWGVNSYLTGASDVVVATVNGTDIKQTRLQSTLQQYRDQMRSVMGDEFDPSVFEGDEAKRMVLQGLIEEQLLRDANVELGQTVSDALISQIVRSTPAFQRDGVFNSEQYGLVLARAGYSPASYEAQLRTDMLARELTQTVEASAIVGEFELTQFLSVAKQQREIAYGVVPIQDYLEQVQIEETAIKAYYEDNQASFTAPEQVTIDYIELSVEDLASKIEITDDALKQYYAENESQFVAEPQIRVSHILIEGTDDEAKALIDSAQTRIEAGEDFAALATELSQDPGSADQGGDLGFIGRGVMVEAFEEAAFALTEIDQVSAPIETEFGFHLIKLTDKQNVETQAFTSVRDEVEKRYRQQEAQKLFFDDAELLANLTFEHSESLEAAAEALDLTIQTTGSFTRNGGVEGITAEPKVVTAAFSDDVLKDDLNSAVIELSDSHMVVIHQRDYTPESILPYEAVSPAIEQQLLFDEASALAKEKGEFLLAELQSGSSPEDFFANWTEASFYQRDSEAVSAQVLNTAFAMPKPAAGASIDGFQAQNGNYIVVAVTAIDEGSAENSDLTEQAMLKQQMAQLQASAERQAFIESLRATAKIEIKDPSLQ
jgi:peptidyl-prolyl cis-trans isomerase D